MTKPLIIYRHPPAAGFFSNFLCVLEHIREAEQRGLTPVVDMQNFKTHFNDPDANVGTENSWEYYFEQPGSLSLEEALSQEHDRMNGYTNGYFTGYNPEVGLALRTEANHLVQRHIRIQSHIQALVDDFASKHFTENMLGVHVRGSDMRQALNRGHPVPANPMKYLETAIAVMEEFACSKCFLATEEIETINLFQRELGDRVCFTKAFRVSSTEATHKDYDWLFKHSRPQHRYLLGAEVLVDALLLSRATHLVCGFSGVGVAAQIFADKLPLLHVVPPVILKSTRFDRAKYLAKKAFSELFSSH